MDEKILYIALSGGYDPLHIGHIRQIEHAAIFGDVLIFLNSDYWLQRKKGYVFMPFEQRKEILQSMVNVRQIYEAHDEDDTVINSIRRHGNCIKAFGKGGDRNPTNTPEYDICMKLGIPVIFGLGGSKVQSSSELIENVKKSI